MVNQVQTTLAIEIIYYFLINAIKISILFFYLRIGKTSTFCFEPSLTMPSCGEEVRVPLQRHHLLSHSILCCLCDLLPDAMYTSVQNVGLYRHGSREMHQHDGTVLQ